MSHIFFCLLPGVNGYGSVSLEPFPITNISSRFFRRRGEGCHFRFRAPANHLASTFSLPVSGDLRLLSTNTCWYPLCDLHSFLTVTFLTGCHCSFQREDSINLISIVSVGYHVTFSWFKREKKEENDFTICFVTYLLGFVVIYEAFCFDVAQGRMNRAPNEIRTHSWIFAGKAC